MNVDTRAVNPSADSGSAALVLDTAASVQDRDGGAAALDRLRVTPSVAVVRADGGYGGRGVAYARQLLLDR